MSWMDELVTAGPVITDGAWGTQMQARGLGVGEFPDAWNLSQPDRVFEVAQAYVQAGSEVILTNTFGATRPRLTEAGLADRVSDINREGARISVQAAKGRVKVFGSMGPTGKMLMTGDITVDVMRTAFAEQAAALADGGVDALVVETMSDPDEARVAVEAGKATGLPVVACMVFDAGKGKDRTMMGTTPEQAAAVLTEAGADVIGSNCGQGIAGFEGLCRRLKAVADRPVWIKANAGIPEMVDGKVVYRTTPGEFAGYWEALEGAGASFVGGCCGTSPEFIHALVVAREERGASGARQV